MDQLYRYQREQTFYGKEKYYKAGDGYSLVTTIDQVIQHYTEKALDHSESLSGLASWAYRDGSEDGRYPGDGADAGL